MNNVPKTNYDHLIKKINKHISNLEQITLNELELKDLKIEIDSEKALSSNKKFEETLLKFDNFFKTFDKKFEEFEKYKITNEIKIDDDKFKIDLEVFKNLKSILEGYKSLNLLSLKESILFLNKELIYEEDINRRLKLEKEYKENLAKLEYSLSKIEIEKIDSIKNDVQILHSLPTKIENPFSLSRNKKLFLSLLTIISIVLILVSLWMIIV